MICYICENIKVNNITAMFIDDLKNHMTKFSTIPFLFIGSGFSRIK